MRPCRGHRSAFISMVTMVSQGTCPGIWLARSIANLPRQLTSGTSWRTDGVEDAAEAPRQQKRGRGTGAEERCSAQTFIWNTVVAHHCRRTWRASAGCSPECSGLYASVWTQACVCISALTGTLSAVEDLPASALFIPYNDGWRLTCFLRSALASASVAYMFG